MASERLSKYLARSGIASRRKSDEIIRSGKISVNGETVTDPFFQVEPEKDRVTFEGKRLHDAPTRRYIALYKPAGYMSDLKDPKERRLARELISVDTALFPVGRLDYNSEGLMIFTNDGDFANRLMHPRFEVEKEYHVKLSGRLTPWELERMVSGMRIEGQVYRVKSVQCLRETAKNAWYRIVVTEGKNRMIRKMADAISHPVLKLKRTRIDHITLGDMKPGEFRRIDSRQIDAILNR